MTLSSATTPGQSVIRSDVNEGVLRSLQSSMITEASPSDYLVSYQGNSLGESYPLAEIQLVHSAYLVNGANVIFGVLSLTTEISASTRMDILLKNS